MRQATGDYRGAIYASYLTGQGEESPETVAAHIRVRANHCARIVKDFFPADRNASILELGCGHGALLYHAQAAGYHDIRGVDASPSRSPRAAVSASPISPRAIASRLSAKPRTRAWTRSWRST
jgi:SAM-dependent methyltransferase